jgi:hypothetical protein
VEKLGFIKSNNQGHSLLELVLVLSLLIILSTPPTTALSRLSLKSQIRSIRELIILNKILAIKQNSTINLFLEQRDLVSGIEVETISFGKKDKTIQINNKGVIAAGRLSIKNKRGNFCSLVISLRNAIRENCG